MSIVLSGPANDLNHGIILAVPGEEFKQVGEAESTLFKKELLAVGEYVDGYGTEFSASESDLRAWVGETNRILAAGVKVPAPLNHSFNPEDARGEWSKFTVEKNSKGVDAAFGYIDLKDHPNLAKSGVSIYLHRDAWTCGTGDTFQDFFQHVCFTSYPQIPGLDPFERVVALSKPLAKVKTKMEPQELAKLLNVEWKEGMSAQDVTNAANANATALSARIAELEKKVATPAPKEDEVETDPQVVAMSARLVKSERSTRELQIDTLAKEGKLTPAQVTDLKKAYCGDNLSFSALETDGFEGVLAVLKNNVARTGKEVVVLGRETSKKEGSVSPMQRAAQRRVGS